MRAIIESIKARLNAVNEQIFTLDKSIRKTEHVTLMLSTTRGTVRFYEYNDVTKEKRYLGSNIDGRIRELAQKRYETEVLAKLKTEHIQLSRCLEILERHKTELDCDMVLPSLRKELRDLVTPFSGTNEGFVVKWMSERYYTTNKENHTFATLRKDKVRSKSEVIIADRLYSAGIPYRYEERIVLTDNEGRKRTYYPDFTCLNKRTQEIYYWEHLGMLGDNSYCIDNLTKMDIYLLNGICPGKNLIVTYECKGKSLLTFYVDQMIKQFLS